MADDTSATAMARTARQPQPVRWLGIGLFLAIAFTLAWSAVIANPSRQVSALGFIAVAQFSPALAAAMVRGPLLHEGFGDSGFPLCRSGNCVSSYLIAYLLVPCLLAGGIALAVLSGMQHWALDDSAVKQTTHSSALSGIVGLLLGFSIWPIILSLAIFGEEFGWRGYLLPRLLPLGPHWATLITGVVWAVWHAPLNILYGVNGGVQGMPFFIVWLVGLGAVLAWLRFRSGSIWPAALLHAAVNAQPPVTRIILAPPSPFAFRALQIMVIVLALTLVVTGALRRASHRGG